MNESSGLPRGFVPLRSRLTILISLAVLLFGSLNLLVVGVLSYHGLTRQQERRLRFVAELLAKRIESPLLYDDRVALDQLVQQSTTIDPDIAYIVVSDPSGRPNVHSFGLTIPSWVLTGPLQDPSRAPLISFGDGSGQRFRDIAVPILEGRLGQVRVGVAELGITKEVARVLSFLAAMVSVFLVVGLGATRLVAHRVTRPLQQITHALATFRLDGPRLQLDVTTRDEVERVASHVTRMAERLQDLYRQERERERELERVERLAALGTLAAGIAHEVNNPLAGVKSAAQRLLHHADDKERVSRYATVIQDSVDRIEGTVHRVLEFSHRGRLHVQAVGAATCVRKAVELAGPTLLALGTHVTVEDGAETLKVRADSNLMIQIVLNLLLNAADAVAGAENGTVRVGISGPSNGRAHITVSDSGPGVPREIAERIFDPFFTTKRPGAGTGLGLSVSWTAAREMGGDLVLERPGGPGAVFRVDLPAWKERR